MAEQVAISQRNLNAMGQKTPQSQGTVAGPVKTDKQPVQELPTKPHNGNY